MATQYSPLSITAARSLQTYTYLCVSMFTFWVYDYICSLDKEWTFLFQSRWTKVKGLYIVTRYVPFAFLIENMYMNFSNGNPHKCQTFNTVCIALIMVSVICSECSFILRTYALWSNNRFVLAAMLFTLFAATVASATATFTSTANAPFQTSGIPGITGCYLSQDSFKYYFIPYLLLFILELVILSLTLIQAIQNWWMASNSLYTVFLKHNIGYYVCGLFFSGLNIVTSLVLKYAYAVMFDNLQVVILAILATRMHLHLWHSDRQRHDPDAITFHLNFISSARTSET